MSEPRIIPGFLKENFDAAAQVVEDQYHIADPGASFEPVAPANQEPPVSSGKEKVKQVRKRSASKSQARKTPKITPVSVTSTPGVLPDELSQEQDNYKSGSVFAEQILAEQEGNAPQKSEEINPAKIEKEKTQPAEADISSVQSFDELFVVLDRYDGIQGSKHFFSSEELKRRVELVRNGEERLVVLTERANFREIVRKLLENELMASEKVGKVSVGQPLPGNEKLSEEKRKSEEAITKMTAELDDLRMAYAKKDYEETGVWKRLSGIFGKNFKDEKALDEKTKYRSKLQELLDARLELLRNSGKDGEELKKAMAEELKYFGTESKIKLYDAWTNAQMEKKGFSEKILELGRQYNKLPLLKKVAIGAAVFGVAGAAAGGLLGTAGGVMAASLLGLRRGVVAGGLFATFEAGLEKLSQKLSQKDVLSEADFQSESIAEQNQTPEERMAMLQELLAGKVAGIDSELASRVKGRDRRRMTALVGAVGATFGLAEVWNYFNGAENVNAIEVKDAAKGAAGAIVAATENAGAVQDAAGAPPVLSTPTAGAYAQPSPGHFDAPSDNYKEALKIQADAKILENAPATYDVVKGDNTWKILDVYLTDHDSEFAGMTEGQQTHAIDALKDKLKLLTPDQLKEAGFTSGNIDKLRVGDTIDLDKLLGTADADTAMSDASNISVEAQSSIEANNAKIANWAEANPGEAINDSVIDEEILGKGGVNGSDVHGRTGGPELLNSFDSTSTDQSLHSVSPAEGVLSPAEAPLESMSPVEMRRGSDWFMQIFRVDDQVSGKDWISDKKEILGTKMSDILKVESNGSVSVKENTNFNLAQSKNLQEFTSQLPKVFPGGRAALSDFMNARPNISVGEYIARVAKVVPQGTRIGLYTTTN